MNKRIVFAVLGSLLVIAIIMVCMGVAFAKNDDANIQGIGSNDVGYILVGTGTTQGNTQQGIWTNPDFLKGEKGDTGATGLQGLQGIQGLKGDMGIQGLNGFNGLDGAKGDKGDNGFNGLNGVDGNNGLDGINGIDGVKGDTGDKGNKGDLGNKGDIGLQGLQGIQGITGLNGKDVNPKEVKRLDNRIDDVSNRVSKLEKTQFVVKTELKFIREKHLEVGVYGEYNVGRSVCSEVGLNIVIPIGESYLDRENKRINTRLDRLEQNLGQSAVITKVVDTKGNTKSISISQGQLAVSGKF